jgi:hypothetical protein
LQKFPLRKGNFKSEKNYNYLLVALFKKVKNKDDFDFVKAEIYCLELQLNSYCQDFYKNLEKRYK